MQDHNIFGCKIYSEAIFLGLNFTLHTHTPAYKYNKSGLLSFHFLLHMTTSFIKQENHFKSQLQRFHKLISNDRIWPSEHGFEVIFKKSLFVFEISAFKVRNKRGIPLGFTRFPKIIIGKPSSVTSQVINAP